MFLGKITMTEKKWFWEDFLPGRRWCKTRDQPLQQAEIIEFAQLYDPLPMHVDPELAVKSPLGVHCASGIQTLAISQRLLYDAFLLDTQIVAGGKLDCVRLVAPVVTGDYLTLSGTVLDVKPHSKMDGYGWVTFDIDITVQPDKLVLMYTSTMLMVRRECFHL